MGLGVLFWSPHSSHGSLELDLCWSAVLPSCPLCEAMLQLSVTPDFLTL